MGSCPCILPAEQPSVLVESRRGLVKLMIQIEDQGSETRSARRVVPLNTWMSNTSNPFTHLLR